MNMIVRGVTLSAIGAHKRSMAFHARIAALAARLVPSAPARVISLPRLTAREMATLRKERALFEAALVRREKMALYRSVIGDARRIMVMVCDKFDISENLLLSNRRLIQLVNARQLAMMLCRDYTRMSLPQIGRLFGNRDHTTVLHACRKLERIEATPEGAPYRRVTPVQCSEIRANIRLMRELITDLQTEPKERTVRADVEAMRAGIECVPGTY